MHKPAESVCAIGDIHPPPLLWYYIAGISNFPSRRNFRGIDKRRENSARLFTIYIWVSDLRSTPSILVQALNSKLCSPMLLNVVRHGSHTGWYYLPQAPKEGLIVVRKAIRFFSRCFLGLICAQKTQLAYTHSRCDSHQSLRECHICSLSLYLSRHFHQHLRRLQRLLHFRHLLNVRRPLLHYRGPWTRKDAVPR